MFLLVFPFHEKILKKQQQPHFLCFPLILCVSFFRVHEYFAWHQFFSFLEHSIVVCLFHYYKILRNLEIVLYVYLYFSLWLFEKTVPLYLPKPRYFYKNHLHIMIKNNVISSKQDYFNCQHLVFHLAGSRKSEVIF